MKLLDPTVRAAYQELASPEMDILDGHAVWFHAHFHRNLQRTDYPSHLAFDAAVCLNMSLVRAAYLINGFVQAVNDRNAPLAILTSRAHRETTGTVATGVIQLLRLREKAQNVGDTVTAFRRLTHGSKLKYDDGAPEWQPFNVLTLIDNVEKLAARLGLANAAGFREQYDLQSEYCHPNSPGLAVGLRSERPFEGTFAYPAFDGPLEVAQILAIGSSEALLRRFAEELLLLIEEEGAM